MNKALLGLILLLIFSSSYAAALLPDYGEDYLVAFTERFEGMK